MGGGGGAGLPAGVLVSVVHHPSVVCICLSVSLSLSLFPFSVVFPRTGDQQRGKCGLATLCEVSISLLVHVVCLSAQETATTHACSATSLANDGVL